MTTSYVGVDTSMTVGAARAAVKGRGKEHDEFSYTAYALPILPELLGVVPLRDMLTNDTWTRLEDILATNVISVTATIDQEECARKMAKYDLNAMPVVDESGKLL